MFLSGHGLIVSDAANFERCHPESAAADEGSPAMMGMNLQCPGSLAKILVGSQDAAIKSDTFREILRPTEGLRMTVVLTQCSPRYTSLLLSAATLPHSTRFVRLFRAVASRAAANIRSLERG
jgi:hypothetical protein